MHRNSVKTNRLRSGLDSVTKGKSNNTATPKKRKKSREKLRTSSALLDKKRGHRNSFAKDTRQTIFLNCYRDTMDISKGCEASGITRRTFYNWMREDDFKESFEDIVEGTKDWVESTLLKKVAAGDTTALIYYTKCKMRDRGYAGDNALAKMEISTNVNLFLGKQHRDSIIEAGQIEPENMKDSPGKRKLLEIIARNEEQNA